MLQAALLGPNDANRNRAPRVVGARLLNRLVEPRYPALFVREVVENAVNKLVAEIGGIAEPGLIGRDVIRCRTAAAATEILTGYASRRTAAYDGRRPSTEVNPLSFVGMIASTGAGG